MTVELFGLARSLAGAPRIELAIDEPTDLTTFVRALGDAHPELVGSVIAPAGDALLAPNYLLLDGRRSVEVDDRFSSHDNPCLLFLASGG